MNLLKNCKLFRRNLLILRNECKYYYSDLTERKRFYNNVSVVSNEDKYEINLDGRKLKTPNGNVFYTYNQWLALIVANEWESQRDKIVMSSMHLTQLTNTVIDNPNNSCRQTIANEILDFIDFDTLCFRVTEPKELSDLQRRQWDPMIEWFEKRFDSRIPITETVHLSPISQKTKELLLKHLLSHNRWSLIGLKFATENLKSLILSLALTQRNLSIDYSIELSRLEENFAIEKWGRLESIHDLELNAFKARVSAALLFYFSNCEVRQLTKKTNSSLKSLNSLTI